MSKWLQVAMGDGAVWHIEPYWIAQHRAEYYAQLDSERGEGAYQEIYDRELDYTMRSDDELIDWASNNMDWADVRGHATLSNPAPPPDYARDWTNAEKCVIELNGASDAPVASHRVE